MSNRIILLVCVGFLLFLCARAASHDKRLGELWEIVSTLNFCGEELHER